MLTGEQEWYPAGSQLTLYYGAYANQTLLMEYGFALENTPYCYVNALISPFHFQLPESITAKIYDLGLNRKYYFKIAIRHICFKLLDFARTLLWDKSLHSPKSFLYPSDLSLELSVLSATVTVVNDLITAYPTTVTEDEEVKPVSIRHYFAVTYRKGLKKCLIAQREYLEDLMEVLKAGKEGCELGEALERLSLKTEKGVLKEYIDRFKGE